MRTRTRTRTRERERERESEREMMMIMMMMECEMKTDIEREMKLNWTVGDRRKQQTATIFAKLSVPATEHHVKGADLSGVCSCL